MTVEATVATLAYQGKDPLVSILIPTRDNHADLLACLDTIVQLDYPKDLLEIRIFDNGSSTQAHAPMEERLRNLPPEERPRIMVQRSQRNLGAFGGRAAAMQDLDPKIEFILSLDDDVELRSDSLRVLLSDMQDPQIAVVGARIVYHGDPHEIASTAGYLNRLCGSFSHRAPTETTLCDFVSSCGCLIRRSVFDLVGGFDGDYFTSHGDVDLCLKAKKDGFEVAYEPAAVISHKVERGGTRTAERVYYGYRNKILLLRRHLPWWRLAVILPLYALFWAPKIIAQSVIHHRGIDSAEIGAILRALRDAAMGRRGEAK